MVNGRVAWFDQHNEVFDTCDHALEFKILEDTLKKLADGRK